MKTLHYFPLEPIKSRYTYQLCNEWMPNAFDYFNTEIIIENYFPNTNDLDHEIKVGQVLDATGRGIYSLRQCELMLKNIESGKVNNGDIIFLQDYWTPGFMAIPYALYLYGIRDIKIYAMLHAQSVDKYDFTYPMRKWMRGWEYSLDQYIYQNGGGIFVASTIHKKILRKYKFKAPIHVVSLPISFQSVDRMMSTLQERKNQVIFTSRLDTEKNPDFMLKVAEIFLDNHRDWEWVITTSASELRSNERNLIDKILNFANNNKRFTIKKGLSKEQYYNELCKSKIQFNCAYQDFVSWTLLEACIAGCDICYPDFRSFPECIPDDRRYKAFYVYHAVNALTNCIKNPQTHYYIAMISDKYGRLKEAEIILNGIEKEYNIWEEHKING